MALLLALGSVWWWPQSCFPSRTFKKFMKNDMIAHGDDLGSPPPRSHTECTSSYGQRAFNIISIEHRCWSSTCTCNWLLKGCPEQNSLRYWKFSTHNSVCHTSTINHRFGHIIHWLIVLYLQSPCSPSVRHWERQESIASLNSQNVFATSLTAASSLFLYKVGTRSYHIITEVLHNKCKINQGKPRTRCTTKFPLPSTLFTWAKET